MNRRALVDLLQQFNLPVERRCLELPEQGGGFVLPGSRSQVLRDGHQSSSGRKGQSANGAHKRPSVHVLPGNGGNRWDGELLSMLREKSGFTVFLSSWACATRPGLRRG